MQSIGTIGYRWQPAAGGQYLYLQPLEIPTEADWLEAARQILGAYKPDRIFLLIDLVGYPPVLNKGSFDHIVALMQQNKIVQATAAMALGDPNFELVTRMFEASSAMHGFDFTLRPFRTADDATRWLDERMSANQP